MMLVRKKYLVRRNAISSFLLKRGNLVAVYEGPCFYIYLSVE
ncbi:hypothetical protein RV04_GL000005 [Enterococcus hermanniensis]|uniref:Uncharacterized protein n=1 Tax=Enterococcus hermanniensis TaxID=249189 RepID=A0A1L8TRD9_9ENTE|nr:hypothetical protein RV04_GL000005 [Enterococcus hermanniensis]